MAVISYGELVYACLILAEEGTYCFPWASKATHPPPNDAKEWHV